MIDFTKQVALITGAAGNVGQAAAYAFYEAGARLALVGRSREQVVEAFPDLADSADCLFVAADLTRADAVDQMVQEVVDHYGRIDVLANIAGGFKSGTPVHETPVETWDFMLNLNARTVFLVSRAVVPHMIRQGYGKIINIASRDALEGKANKAAYSVAKTAVVRLTESMSAELREKGINVNCIIPATIDTPQNRAATPNADFSKWLLPEQLAQVIVMLAAKEASAISGAVLPVYRPMA